MIWIVNSWQTIIRPIQYLGSTLLDISGLRKENKVKLKHDTTGMRLFGMSNGNSDLRYLQVLFS